MRHPLSPPLSAGTCLARARPQEPVMAALPDALLSALCLARMHRRFGSAGCGCGWTARWWAWTRSPLACCPSGSAAVSSADCPAAVMLLTQATNQTCQHASQADICQLRAGWVLNGFPFHCVQPSACCSMAPSSRRACCCWTATSAPTSTCRGRRRRPSRTASRRCDAAMQSSM